MTNYQAMAYAAIAMKDCGFSQVQINEVVNQMGWQFDMLSEEEAETVFRNLFNGE